MRSVCGIDDGARNTIRVGNASSSIKSQCFIRGCVKNDLPQPQEYPIQSVAYLFIFGRRARRIQLNCSPNGDTIGRGLKVNKEEMLGMLVAVETFLKRDAQAEWREWERRAKTIVDAATSSAHVQAEIYVPPIANHVPHVRVTWQKSQLPISGPEVRRKLREGDPAIEIVPGGSPAADEKQELSIGVWQLQPGEAEIVAKRVKESLR